MVMKKVLLVEDDDVLRNNYNMLLTAHRLSVTTSSNKSDAISAFAEDDFDAIILDVTLHSDFEAGFELCQKFRSQKEHIPIIFLTERDEDADRISGLRLGADDYLSKTISGAYLVARISALIKRFEILTARQVSHAVPHKVGSQAGLRIDENLSCAYWDGTKLNLSLTQFWILKDLYLNTGAVRSVTDLMKSASITVQPNTIVAHIKAIRDEIQKFYPEFSGIKSERARGYRWIADPGS
jgi:two-component system OmpR family response regulator